MSASTAIGMVGESLKSLLEDEMQLTPDAPVTLLAPDETGATRRINLFLYKVEENALLRNMDWQVSATNPARINPPPLSLNLFYFLTPYAQNDVDTGNTSIHEILGEAMRVFHENPIIPQDNLVDGLKNTPEQIKITPSRLDLEELTRVWGTFTQPFRLSVPYEVSVVQLDQSVGQSRDMAPRVSSIGVPQVAAPFQPPSIEEISPIQGPVGTVVTVSGSNLDGWRAYATIARQTIATAAEISGESFDVTIPTGLPAGFHQLRIDVSRLARNTFFFEVTP
jgi:hypothetical protein